MSSRSMPDFSVKQHIRCFSESWVQYDKKKIRPSIAYNEEYSYELGTFHRAGSSPFSNAFGSGWNKKRFYVASM